MQAVGSPETYEIYTSTWRHILEEYFSQYEKRTFVR
jgi:hypothetical protein